MRKQYPPHRVNAEMAPLLADAERLIVRALRAAENYRGVARQEGPQAASDLRRLLVQLDRAREALVAVKPLPEAVEPTSPASPPPKRKIIPASPKSPQVEPPVESGKVFTDLDDI